ncbi:MAG: ribulose-5-phosphate 4-epimerase-like epimerase or aldolase [Xanthobacteraceae bacterium]|nr:ribulose-5-phosphate 4-epimerase-like epimerase or aldolase [Xanthobacteraceae bacterium]
MTDPLAAARHELALANRIIANEGVIDAFGHVSMRHPTDPNRYLLSRSRSPELVEPDDIYEFTLDSQPVTPPKERMYGERPIHGCIYQARPDVMAVCHHHSAAVLPFCVTGEELLPMFHLGATMGTKVPIRDSRDDFGDTNMVVIKPEEGASLAKALGPYWMVLMRRHGATLAGRSLKELVFRTIYSTRNAEMQLRSAALGKLYPLSAGEAALAGEYNLQISPLSRAFEYWSVRLQKAEAMTDSKFSLSGKTATTGAA